MRVGYTNLIVSSKALKGETADSAPRKFNAGRRATVDLNLLLKG